MDLWLYGFVLSLFLAYPAYFVYGIRDRQRDKLVLELIVFVQDTAERIFRAVESTLHSFAAFVPSPPFRTAPIETSSPAIEELTQHPPTPDPSPPVSPKHMSFDVDRHPTDAALANRSNFCFLNATLHCLFRSPHFLTSLHRSIRARARQRWRDESTPAVAMAKCCAALLEVGFAIKNEADCGGCVDVVELGLTAAMRACSSSLIAQSSLRQVQQDAEECLSFFIDILNDQATDISTASLPEPSAASQLMEAIHLASSDDPATYAHLVARLAQVTWEEYSLRHPSFVTHQFTAQVVRGSSCNSCHRLSCRMQETSVLSLALHSSTLSMSLESCLDQFKAIEDMVGDNQVWCAHCQSKTNQAMQTLLVHTPPCLVLQLKRFTCDGAISKNSAGVYFPVHRLNLSPACFARTDVTSSNYRLYAVCAHVGGSLHRGHYVAYCRMRQTHTTSQWLRYDDEDVSIVEEAAMLHETLRTAYLLFYERFDVA